jgi:cobaltochelatase CobN
MHLLVRDTRTIDEEAPAVDLGHSPADLVLLSFADTDLGAAAAAWRGMGPGRPSLRLANLAQLRHPMSVDLYLERTIARARMVLVRLLGGIEYWRYGVEELSAACRRHGIALALVPGDARPDPALAELSTVTAATLARLEAYFRHGGPANIARALGLMVHLGGLAPDHGLPAEIWPQHGVHPLACMPHGDRPCAAIVFYRAHLQAGDLAPIEGLAMALDARGLDARALYIASLKEAESAAFVSATLREWRPAIVLNATGFAARLDPAGASPLDAAGAPVLQLVLAGSAREAWQASSRGLSQSDLAMQVVLPELDGRLLTTAISFKADDATMPEFGYARRFHRPDADGIRLAVERAAGWARLAGTSHAARRLAVVLSDYPGAGGQIAHAVGLDAIASLCEILSLLGAEGYDLGEGSLEEAAIVRALCVAPPAPFLSLARYHRLFAELPRSARDAIIAAWGEPEADPAVIDGAFALRHAAFGQVLVAVQPDRGSALDRKAAYHDPDLPPRHAYVAFYLWLGQVRDIHALAHLGTHGTLEWLPGKAVALSSACFPVALAGGLPVVYPFIVNNPGEAAAAKRRLGAVTIGHLTPPLKSAGNHGEAAELERLIDEYAAADGLDRRRTGLLRRQILERAEAAGLIAEAGIAWGAAEDDALARLDAYLCDVKDLQIRDGLHVYGRAPTAERRAALLDALQRACPDVPPPALADALDRSAAAERDALLAALDGRFVAPGPAGAPTRGRADVLPTGRNLYAIDPRAVPTRSALALAEKAADALLSRHLQEHGDWPRALVLDVWGSATMRTGGEDLALALVLMGARPVWDGASSRASGVEILPLAQLDRPRIDVTLRISGLFRDVFETQILLFDAAVRAIAERDEPAEWNALAAAVRGMGRDAFRRATVRVFGAAPGLYGAGWSALVERGAWRDRAKLGAAYLDASAAAYGQGLDGASDAEGFAARVAAADAFVHQQDHREVDVLDSLDYAEHEGGFAAAADLLGSAPALYHMDSAEPDAPRVRALAEEIARVVRGRAANPRWIAGMLRHGYRGGAEIARTIEGLYAFAASLPARLDRQFDLLFDATLGDPEVERFLQQANPDARDAMAARFAEALSRDLWRPRRNVVAAMLGRHSQ